MRARRLVLAAIAILASWGCGGAQQPSAGKPTDEIDRGDTHATLCPLGVPELAARGGTRPDGAALVLTTDREHTAELRARVFRYVRAQREAAALDPDGSLILASELSVISIPRGTRLEIVPRNADRIREARREAELSARDLEQGRCPLVFDLGA